MPKKTIFNPLSGSFDFIFDQTASEVPATPHGDIAATDVQAQLEELETDKQSLSEKGAANGYAPLDASSTVPIANLPDAVLGGPTFQGTWNANTNTPDLSALTPTQGQYYRVSVAGTTNLDGITDWGVGDWAIYNGTAWDKIDNSEAVSSVNGQTGVVVLTATSVGAANQTLSNLTSPTAVNQNLVADGDLTRNLGSNTFYWGLTRLGDTRVTALGVVDGAKTTRQTLVSSLGLGTTNVNIPVTSGPGLSSSVAGQDYSMQTPASAATDTGLLYLLTGPTTGAGNDSGNLYIETGNSGSANSGHLRLATGLAAAGVRGDISFQGNTFNVAGMTSAKASQIWKKYTISHTALQAAALSNDIELFSLPAFGAIHNVIIKHSTAFSGTGITAYTLSVGISGNLTKYASAFDVFQATGAGVGQSSSVFDFESMSGATSIRLSATSTGANLDQSAAGSVDVYVLWGTVE